MKKNYSFLEKTIKAFVMFSLFFLTAMSSFSQTTLINPAGDGGFESGATYAANNWVAVNGATDGWFVGSTPVVASGANCGFVSATAGAAWTYSQISLVTHVYKDFTVPAGENKLTLNFKWKVGGEGTTTSDWDNMKVFLAPTTYTPTTAAVTGQTQLIGPGAISGMYKLNSTVWNNETITFVGTPGTSYRLIFSWKSDGSTIANPPAALDDVSLISSTPGNFISIATGNWGTATTWDANAVPTAGDNVTIANTHTVTIDAAAQAANNLLVQNGGILTYGATPTSFVVNNLTVDLGGLFNLFNGTTGKTLNVAGNILNNGRINTFVGTANQLVLNGTQVQTVSGTGVFGGTVVSTTTTNEVGVIRQLICANTNISTPNIIWDVNNIRIAGVLNTTGGRIALGSNKIYIGNFGAITTHTGPVGTGFIGGSIGRFWTATATGTTITAGTDPTNTTSRYPFLSPTGVQRALYITRTTGGTNTTGYLTVAYTDAFSVTTGLTALDGAYTVTDRADANWNITTENGYSTTTATHTLAIVANSLLNAATTNVRVMNATTFVGTHQNGTTTPGGQRTAITTAQLTGGPFYLGLNTSEISNSSITSGDWNNTSTWSKGTVPVCTDGVLINAGHTVTVNSSGNSASNTTISNTGSLVISSGDLTVGCTNNNTPLTNNGTLTISGGTLTVNGNINNALVTSVFNQSGGAIIIDGNSGTVATSVANAVGIFNSESTNINLTAGTLTFVDPHASVTTGSNLVIRLNNATASTISLASSPNHTTIFGDGISTTQSGVPADGFRINNWVGTAYLSLGSFEVNGNNATGRSVTSVYQLTANGNVTIKNNSILSLTSALVVGGNLDVNVGGTFINIAGIASSIVTSNTGSTLNFGPTTLAQVFTNNGTCSNLAVSPTANFNSLTVNNTNATGITLASPFRVSGALTFISGIVNTSNTNLLSHGTITAAGTLTMPGTIPANTFVNGPIQRTIASANTNATYVLFPVGNGTTYAPASIAPTTTSVVEMKVETFGANTGTPDATIINLSSTRRWEAPIVTGTITNLNVRLSDNGVLNTSVPAVGSAAAGVYNGVFGAATYTAGANGTPNTLQSNSALALVDYTGFLSYADPNACTGVPTPGNTTTTSALVCPSVNFTLGLQTTTTGTGVTYQWQSSPDGIAPYVDIAGQTATTATVSQTAATYYQCVVTCTSSTLSTISTPLQVNMNSVYACYCASTYVSGTGTTGGDAITNVTLGTLNNSSNGGATPTPSPYYTFYNAVSVPDLTQGSGQTMTVSFGTDGTQYTGVWIDYNKDGDLLDAGEFVANSTLNAGVSGTSTLNFTVPVGATLGNTLMRVRGGNDSVLTNTPCGASSSAWGETEDYIVNITPCVAPAITTQPVTPISVCENAAVNLSVTATGTGLTYQWKKDTVDIPSATSATYSIPSALVADSGSYTVLVTGACGTILSDASTVTVTANSTLPTEVVSVCDTYTWAANGTTYTTSGIYTNVVNCVTRTLDLTITPSSSLPTEVVSVCDTYTWAANGTTYTTSGIYTNVVNCVTRTLDLTITPSSSLPTEVVSVCDTYTWAANGTTYTTSGIYTNVVNCVTRTLDLTITPSSSLPTEVVSVCDTYTWAANGTTYTTTGIYTNVVNCVTRTLDLTITPSSSLPTEVVSSCDSYTWAANGSTYTTSGVYTNVVNCVTRTLNLTINASTTTTTNVTVCDTYTWAENGLTYTVGGTYTNVTTNGAGCPNTATLNLVVTNASIDFANLQFPASATICEGGTMTAYGQVYEPGFTEAAGQAAGIDVEFGYNSTNTNPNTWSTWAPATFNVQVGNNDEYMFTTSNALTGGTYYYTFRYRLSGCSTWQYGGDNNGFWNGTTQNSGVLTINVANTPTGASTQTLNGGVAADVTIEDIVVSGTGIIWYPTLTDANAGTNPIAAGTVLTDNTTYYAVSVNGICRSSALAVTVTVVLGKTSFDLSQLNYYPNPVKDIFNVKYSKEIISIDVYDLTGRNVINLRPNALDVQVNMTNLSSAMYIVRLQSVDGIKELKVYKN